MCKIKTRDSTKHAFIYMVTCLMVGLEIFILSCLVADNIITNLSGVEVILVVLAPVVVGICVLTLFR